MKPETQKFSIHDAHNEWTNSIVLRVQNTFRLMNSYKQKLFLVLNCAKQAPYRMLVQPTRPEVLA